MTAKEYLQQLDKIDFLIKCKQQEIDVLQAKLFTGINYESDGSFKCSTDTTKNERIILQIIELEEEINDQLSELIELKKEIIDVVDKLKDNNELKVVYLRYFQHYKWSKIEKEMTYSRSQLLRIHANALSNIDLLLKHETKCDY